HDGARVAASAQVGRGVDDVHLDLAADQRVGAGDGDGGAVRGLPERVALVGEAAAGPGGGVEEDVLADRSRELAAPEDDLVEILLAQHTSPARRWWLRRGERAEPVQTEPQVTGCRRDPAVPPPRLGEGDGGPLVRADGRHG